MAVDLKFKNILDYDWDETIDNNKIVTFSYDPLPIAISLRRQGSYSQEIVSLLSCADRTGDAIKEIDVTTEDLERAETIYRHFAYRILKRRLNNQHVSDFMKFVENLCMNRRDVPFDQVKILATLDRFYEENVFLDDITESHKTQTHLYANHKSDFKLKYLNVLKTHKRAKGMKYQYFWETEDNELVMIETSDQDTGRAAWSFFTQRKYMTVNGVFRGRKIIGYDFWAISPDLATLEIIGASDK